MRIILHAGVQCTDDERLLKTLLRNKETFEKAGVAIPHPKSYRTLLDKMLTNKNNPMTGENFLAIILKDTTVQSHTVILSNPLFFGSSKEVLGPQQLYPNAVKSTEQFLHLFAEDDVNLYFSIRNPASFLPAVFETSKLSDFSAFLKTKNPLEIRWSEFASRLRKAFPDLPIHIWCNEYSPFIWGQILRQMGQLSAPQNIAGDFDLFAEIISDEGFERFKAYVRTHPSLTPRQLRIVMGAFAEKFGQNDKIIEEIEAPGWDEALVQDLTERYDIDVRSIDKISTVQFISPE